MSRIREWSIMLYILEFATILAYMINGKVGMLFMVATIIVAELKSFPKGLTIFRLLILSLPLAAIGVGGIEMHQVLSWYNLFLLILMYQLLVSAKIKKGCIVFLSAIIVCLLGTTMCSNNISEALIECIQIIMMVAPIALLYKSDSVHQYKQNEIKGLMDLYATVSFLSAIALIVQFVAFKYAATSIGIIEHSNRRVSYFLLFRGPSIPIYLGTGLMKYLYDMLYKKIYLKSLAVSIVICIAIVLNSSRSGVFAVLVVAGYSVLMFTTKKIVQGKLSLKPIIVTVGVCLVGFFGISYVLRLRSISFFDDNGRFELMKQGIQIWLHDPINFVFGEGFSGGLWNEGLSPHNMIIQTISECGLAFALIVFLGLLRYVTKNYRSPYFECVLFTLVYGMLVTEFYVNSFTTIIFILVNMYRRGIINSEPEGIDDKSTALLSRI